MTTDRTTARVDGFVFKVCMHFAANPDALLTSVQAAKLYELGDGTRASSCLRRAVRQGWLAEEKGKPCEYTAGPEILRLHGRVS